jgi:hypothetical protein
MHLRGPVGTVTVPITFTSINQCSGSRSRSESAPHIFGPSGTGSTSQRYGSGFFCHQAKKVRKTLIPIVLWLLLDFLSLKNEKMDIQKVISRNFFFNKWDFSWHLKGQWWKQQDPDPRPDPDTNPDPLVRGRDLRIRIRTTNSWIRNTAVNTNSFSLASRLFIPIANYPHLRMNHIRNRPNCKFSANKTDRQDKTGIRKYLSPQMFCNYAKQ